MEYILLIVAFVAIIIGANNLVNGAVSIAKRFHVSDFVIGAAIIGIGTSLPELIVSTVGAISGEADIAIGNVVGSNIFNIFAIVGITAIFFPIAITKENKKFDIPYCIFVTVITTLLAFNFFTSENQTLGWIDGLVLLACFAFYMWYSFKNGKAEEVEDHGNSKQKPLWKGLLMVVLGLGVLIAGCEIFVDQAIIIAEKLGVNKAFISITLIACGTSLPELAASIAAALKKNTQMALGNIVGSCIFNLTLILGTGAQIIDLTSTDITFIDYAIMILASLMPLFFAFKGKINRLGGILLTLIFIGYNAYLIYNQVG